MAFCDLCATNTTNVQCDTITIREGHHQDFHRIVFAVDAIEKPVAKITSDQKILISGLKGSLLKPVFVSTGRFHKVKSITIENNALILNLAKAESLTIKKQFTLSHKQEGKRRFVIDVIKPKSKTNRVIKANPKPASVKSHSKDLKETAVLEQILPNLLKFDPLILRKPIKPMIVIDAGHGGHDPGAVSCHKRYEKHVTLATAKVIAGHLKASGHFHVKLTRTQDQFVPLRKRFEIARRAKADFFISVHADSHPSPKMEGLSIYTLSRTATDKEAARLAKAENAAEFVSDFDLHETDLDVSNILITLFQKETQNTSLRVAQALHRFIKDAKFTKVLTLRAAGLTVLKAPDTPSLLLELGFLSNKNDEKRVHDPNFQKKVAIEVQRALDSYFRTTKSR